MGWLAVWDKPNPEPVWEICDRASGGLESDNNLYAVCPLLIPEALGAHAMCQRRAYGAMLKTSSAPPSRIKSDDDRQWVGAPRKYFVEGLLADWDTASPEPVLKNVASPSG